MDTWIVKTRRMVRVVQAEDQWAAWDCLRDEPPERFGITVEARRADAPEADAYAVRTAHLMGRRWGRPDVARAFILAGGAVGLPDTSAEDLPIEEAV